MADTKYPFVLCHTHPDKPRRSYIVCIHILDYKKDVFDHRAATDKQVGTIVCEHCFQDPLVLLNPKITRILCEACARQKGLIAAA